MPAEIFMILLMRSINFSVYIICAMPEVLKLSIIESIIENI